MSMAVILQQVGIIFGYVFIGWFASKRGVLNSTLNKQISNIIIRITLPLNLISGANFEIGQGDLGNMALAAGILLASYITTAVGVACYARARKLSASKRAVYSSLATFPNSAFIGIPLCVALMGNVGMLYGVAGLISYNSLFFTYQYLLFNPEEKVTFKLFATPLNGSLLIMIAMLLCGVRLPAPVQTVAYNVGAMTTPLALMIVGTMLAEGDLRAMVLCKASYVFSLLRNLLLPMALMLVLTVLPLNYDLKIATIIYAACPCANLTAVFATQKDMEVSLCANTILLSTVLFMGSLPLLLWMAQRLFA